MDEPSLEPIFARLRAGDASAASQLLEAVFSHLRAMAHRALASNSVSLNTTSLINEAYLKLFGNGAGTWEDRSHFLGTAATAMRHIVIDYARHRNAKKRAAVVVPLDDLVEAGSTSGTSLLDINDALTRLAKVDSELVRIVEMRFFAGFTIEETAKVLGKSGRSVVRAWNLARAWLKRDLAP